MDHLDQAKKYKIMQAPTLVVTSGDQYVTYTGVEAIKKYIEEIS